MEWFTCVKTWTRASLVSLFRTPRYDPLSNEWHPAPPLSQPRDCVAVCVASCKRTFSNKRWWSKQRHLELSTWCSERDFGCVRWGLDLTMRRPFKTSSRFGDGTVTCCTRWPLVKWRHVIKLRARDQVARDQVARDQIVRVNTVSKRCKKQDCRKSKDCIREVHGTSIQNNGQYFWEKQIQTNFWVYKTALTILNVGLFSLTLERRTQRKWISTFAAGMHAYKSTTLEP